jgi:hypothetical protein
VRFNAGKHEEINIVISDAIPQEQAEYDRLLRDVTFLAGEGCNCRTERRRGVTAILPFCQKSSMCLPKRSNTLLLPTVFRKCHR